MEKVKEAAPESKTSATPQVEPQLKLPEKKTGPQMVARSLSAATLPPPDGIPPAARAGSVLTSPEGGFGASQRARRSKAVQRSLGNTHMSQFSSMGTRVQTKLTVGAPNDPYEQEADRTADAVLRMPDHRKQNKDENKLQAKPLPNQVTLMSKSETGQVQASPDLEQKINNSKGHGKALPEDTRVSMESSLGADFSNINIHTGSGAAEMNEELGAKAFTHGSDIYFNQGQYDPESRSGKHLLAHELTHVVQQDHGVRHQSVATLLQRQPQTTAELSTQPPAQGQQPMPPDVTRRLIYASTVLRNVQPLTPDQEAFLDQSIGGTALYIRIRTKRSKLDELERLRQEYDRIRPEHGLPEIGSTEELRMQELDSAMSGVRAEVEELDHLIRPDLDRLGVGDEQALLSFIDEEFPRMFINRAKQVVYAMLDQNRAIAEGERDRYSEQICSPDIEGLLEADQQLARIKERIQSTELSISIGERYRPIAGVPQTAAEYGLPPGAESWIMDIQHLEENRIRLASLQREYEQTFNEAVIKYPILGAKGYQPGRFANASPDDLAALTGQTIAEVIANIERVREDIRNDELKIWNLNNVVELTMEDLGIEDNPILTNAVEAHIRAAQRDESFIRMAMAALAIATTVIAGIVGGPLGAALVGGAWGTAFLVSDIREFQRETAASYVSLDPELADISVNEPTLTWIVIDVVLLGLDAAAVVRAVRPLARALTATRSAEDFLIFSRGVRAALPPEAAEALIRRVSRRFGVSAPAGAREVRVSGADYLRALEHAFPQQYFDEALRAIDDIGRTAAQVVVRDPAFINAVRNGNWALAGTYFHSVAATEGRLAAQAGRLPAGWRFDFELVVQSGKGGSRLDTFLRGPAGEILEIDWKTTGRSALSSGSRSEMGRHARQIADPNNLGLTLTGQRSISWVDEARVAWEDLRRTNPQLAQQLFGGPVAQGSISWPR